MTDERSPERRRAQRVLSMVAELHKTGYQRLRIAPGMSNSGAYWRCDIAPISNILVAHGAKLADWDGPVVRYSTAMETQYFGWSDATTASARELAELFVQRFPDIAEQGRGRDWAYAGWYVEMLGFAESGHFPIAYADWRTPPDAEQLPLIGMDTPETRPSPLPMPPRGEASAPPGADE